MTRTVHAGTARVEKLFDSMIDPSQFENNLYLVSRARCKSCVKIIQRALSALGAALFATGIKWVDSIGG